MHKNYYSLIAPFLLITFCNAMDSYLASEDTFEDLGVYVPEFKNFKSKEDVSDLNDKAARSLIQLENRLWHTPLSTRESQTFLFGLYKRIVSAALRPEPVIITHKTLSKAICITTLPPEEKKRQKKERLKKIKKLKKLQAQSEERKKDFLEFERTLTRLKNIPSPRSPKLPKQSKVQQIVRSLKKKDGNRPFKPGRYRINTLIEALSQYMKDKKSKKLAELTKELIDYKAETQKDWCVIKKSCSNLWIA